MNVKYLWGGIAVASVASVVFAGYWGSRPHFGTATREEILALIPVDLRTALRSDRAAETRFRGIVALASSKSGVEPWLEEILRAGPLRVPAEGSDFRCSEMQTLVDYVSARAMGFAQKGNVAESGRHAILALRLVNAYEEAGGDGSDASTATELLHMVSTRIAKCDHLRGLSAAQRTEILSLLPTPVDSRKRLAETVANDFRKRTLPMLIKAASGRNGLAEFYTDLELGESLDFGTYDPFETTKLFVAYARADQKACLGGRAAIDGALQRRAYKLKESLPESHCDSHNAWQRLGCRWSNNNSPNTVGRAWSFPLQVGMVVNRLEEREKVRSDLRAMLLAHR